MGLERWGLFTLALALVGVFGVFDLGVGAGADPGALRPHRRRPRTRMRRRWPAPRIGALLGSACIAAIGAWLFVPVLVERHAERAARRCRRRPSPRCGCWPAAAPLVVVNAALWGVLAAHQRFRAANLVTIPVSLFYYLGPVLVLLVWHSLVGVMLALLACRLANTAVLLPGWRGATLPGLGPRLAALALVAPLLRHGRLDDASPAC